MKKVFIFLLVFMIFLNVKAISLNESQKFQVPSKILNNDSLKIANSKISINATEATIYYLLDDYKEDGVSIPSNLPTSFQIEVKGTNIIPEYEIDNDGYPFAKISDTGLVTITDEAFDGRPFEFGDIKFTINVRVANQEFNVKITVIDYIDIYVKNLMQDYIDKNIKDTMSDYEKVETIAKYVLQFEYMGGIPNFRAVFFEGGGDCIALNSIVIQMCKMVGIPVYPRYAGDILGNNHYDLVALIDGKVYYVDASYYSPREYIISDAPLSFKYADGGYLLVSKVDGNPNDLYIAKYSGFETENIKVPTTYSRFDEDYQIKGVLENSFRYACSISKTPIKSVILPEGIESIEANAFSECETLESITLPKSLKEISSGAFNNDINLKNINLDPNNPNYTFEDGILYNKTKTEVIYVLPTKEGELTLPDSVQTIKSYAFSSVNNLTGVIIGKNVKTIESHAFDHANILGLTIPKSVTNIEDNAFYEAKFRFIKFEEGSQVTFKDYMFNGCINLKGILIPSSITNIETNAFRLASSSMILFVNKDSKALEYATKNNKKYEIIDEKNSILSGMIHLKIIKYSYDGLEKRPEVIVLDGGKVLVNNQDYTIKYSNNIDAFGGSGGDPTVTIEGKGNYTGSASITFEIIRATSDVSMEIEDITYGETPNPILIENNAGSKWTDIYYNTVKSYDGATETPPTEVGTYYVNIAVRVSKNSNYGTRNLWAKFNILPAENELLISCPDIEYGNPLKVDIIKNKSGGDITYYYKKANASDNEYTTNVPTLPGSYTVKAVSEATKNYKSGTAIANFKITGEIPFLKGDLDEDSIITVDDAVEALYYYIEKYEITPHKLEIGDMDNDGKITVDDAVDILMLYVNK